MGVPLQGACSLVQPGLCSTGVCVPESNSLAPAKKQVSDSPLFHCTFLRLWLCPLFLASLLLAPLPSMKSVFGISETLNYVFIEMNISKLTGWLISPNLIVLQI